MKYYQGSCEANEAAQALNAFGEGEFMSHNFGQQQCVALHVNDDGDYVLSNTKGADFGAMKCNSKELEAFAQLLKNKGF